MYQTKRLDTEANREMFMHEDGIEEVNCYKLQIANVVNEIVHRHMTHNEIKMKAVMAIETDFEAAS